MMILLLGLISCNDFVYRIIDKDKKTATILKAPDKILNLSPDKFCKINGINYTIIGIEDEAFKNCKDLRTVRISDTIKTIGKKAFYNCTSLIDVDLGDVKFIDENAFQGCTSIYNVLFGGLYDIQGCHNLFDKNITIFVDRNYQDKTFCGYNVDKSLELFIYAGPAVIYKWFNENKKEISLYRSLEKGVYTIPTELVTKETYKIVGIYDGAFRNSNDLTEVIIPDGIKYIGEEAFINCASLQKVTISCDVKYIGENAFKGCSSLNEIIFEGLYDIQSLNVFDHSLTIFVDRNYQDKTFCGYNVDKSLELFIYAGPTEIYKWYNKDKKYVSLYRTLAKGIYTVSTTVSTHPDYSVIKIYDNAFEDRKDLTEVIIPDGIKYIGEEAFINCASLQKVTISSSVEFIDINAFKDCSSLSYVYFNGNNEINYNDPVFPSFTKIYVSENYKDDTFCGMNVIKIQSTSISTSTSNDNNNFNNNNNNNNNLEIQIGNNIKDETSNVQKEGKKLNMILIGCVVGIAIIAIIVGITIFIKTKLHKEEEIDEEPMLGKDCKYTEILDTDP